MFEECGLATRAKYSHFPTLVACVCVAGYYCSAQTRTHISHMHWTGRGSQTKETQAHSPLIVHLCRSPVCCRVKLVCWSTSSTVCTHEITASTHHVHCVTGGVRWCRVCTRMHRVVVQAVHVCRRCARRSAYCSLMSSLFHPLHEHQQSASAQ